MIPMMNIIAWSNVVPWAELRQVEQDLIISRAIVDLFSDPFLREQLRFRGGTALNKLHFPAPIRYSEDIGRVRTTAGPIVRVQRMFNWLEMSASVLESHLAAALPADGHALASNAGPR
jgi:Nucleotidyl transferase AbiEii toxin, Type IV TA system